MSRFGVLRWPVIGLAVVLLLSTHLTAAAAAAIPKDAVEPKVVIIVGPTGDVTDHYIADAD